MKFSNCLKAYKETKISYLGGISISSKIMKNQKVSGQMTYILYLAPANQSGYNVCPNSTPECRLGCLSTSGRAAMDLISGQNVIKNARINKTKLFHENNEYFMQWLFAEIRLKQALAIRKGFEFSVRLNGTSDINWTEYTLNGLNVFQAFPEIQFYDYTKNPTKFMGKPENYHLTFSYSGINTETCKKVLANGHNVAVVFNIKNVNQFPETFLGYPVVNGDLTDYRVNDTKGCIVGLKWKKIANKTDNDTIKNSVFVVQV